MKRATILYSNDGGMLRTGSILCNRHQSGWSQGDVVTVSYADMIAFGGVAPTDVADGKFSCAVVLDANDAPIGAAFRINQVDSEQSVKALLGYFNHVSMVECTKSVIDAIIAHGEANIPE